MVCIVFTVSWESNSEWFVSADDMHKNILLTIKPLNIILLFCLHCNIFMIHDDIPAAVQHNIQVVSENIFSTQQVKSNKFSYVCRS